MSFKDNEMMVKYANTGSDSLGTGWVPIKVTPFKYTNFLYQSSFINNISSWGGGEGSPKN